MGIEPPVIRKMVMDLEKIAIDSNVIEKNSSFLEELFAGIQDLNMLPILVRTQPFFFQALPKQDEKETT